jgi:CubicO group peptidase (beta-lactamase class C family)
MCATTPSAWPPAHAAASALFKRAFLASGAVAAGLVAITPDGPLVRTLGVHSLDLPDPVGPASVFPIASLSKAVTAVAIGRLVDSGRVRLDDPVCAIVPEWRLPSAALRREVRVRDALNNAVGLDPVWPVEEMLGPEVPVASVLERVAHYRIAGPHGATFRYNNLSFVALSVLIERVSGVGFAEFVEREVFAPLGMHTAACSPRLGCKARAIVEPHAGEPSRRLPRRDYPNHQGAGWMYASLHDLAAWLRFWLDPQQTLLSAATRAALARAGVAIPAAEVGLWAAPPGAAAGYGFGFCHTDLDGLPLLQHAGASVGGTAHLLLAPAQRIGIAVCFSGGALYRAALCYALLEVLLEQRSSRDWLSLGERALVEASAAARRQSAAAFLPALADAPSAQACVGEYRGAATGAVSVRVAPGGGLQMAFADAAHWALALAPVAPGVYATTLDEPNDGVRAMAGAPLGRFRREPDHGLVFEHPLIERLTRSG